MGINLDSFSCEGRESPVQESVSGFVKPMNTSDHNKVELNAWLSSQRLFVPYHKSRKHNTEDLDQEQSL